MRGLEPTLQRYLTARGHTVRCNDRYRVAQHHCDLYKGSGLRELPQRHRVDAIVSSPQYGRYTIESAVLAILSLRVPLTILKVPTSFLKRPVCVTHPPSLVIPLPRARYPSFETCTKWPETWVVWSDGRSTGAAQEENSPVLHPISEEEGWHRHGKVPYLQESSCAPRCTEGKGRPALG